MSEGSKDLFGKIDALFEKRAPDALVDKGLDYDDFPLLTEVVGAVDPGPMTWGEPERRVFDRRTEDRRGDDRRSAERRAVDQPEAESDQSGPEPQPPAPAPEVGVRAQTALPGELEDRLAEFFIRQQLRLEEVVRKVVREELDKRLGQESGGKPGDPRG